MLNKISGSAPDVSSISENLRLWLKDGGVLDAKGNPLIVYHGSPTPDSLYEFQIGGVSGVCLSGDAYGVAAYFTTSPSEASFYTKSIGAVFPVIVRGRFLDLDGDLSGEDSSRLTKFAQDLLLPSDKARFAVGRERRTFSDVEEAKVFFESQRQNYRDFGDGMARAEPDVVSTDAGFTIEYTNFDADVRIVTMSDAKTLFNATGWDNLRAAGFDGLIMSREGGAKWICLQNTNGTIKSAIGNNGLFDSNCPDITDSTSYRNDYDLRKAVLASRFVDSLEPDQVKSIARRADCAYF